MSRSRNGISRIPPHWRLFGIAVSGLLLVSLWLRFNAPAMPQPVMVKPRPSSITVLPFLNTNPDSSDNYLGYGIGTELTRTLSQLSHLSVAELPGPLVSGSQANPVEVGERLGVGTVLDGTVRRAGGRLRVTAHLVDVGEGFDLWSETYESVASDLLQVQNEIARAIALTLRVPAANSVFGARLGPTSSTEAYDAYIAGQYLLRRGDSRDAAQTVNYFIQAIRLDSAFALAHAALAEAQMPGVQQELPPRLTLLTAETAARRALQLDSALALPHRILGEIRMGYYRDWPGADREFQRAIELAPKSPDGYAAYSRFLLAIGRREESLAMSLRAVELSPLSPAALEQLGWHYLHTRDFERGRETLTRAIQLDSSGWRPQFDLALLEQAAANYGQARTYLSNAARRAPLRLAPRIAAAQLMALSGQPDTARSIMQGLRPPFWPTAVPPYLEACVQAALGERSKAFASLDQAMVERSELLPYLRIDPRLDQLRADPRYSRLVKRLQLP
ncbi:MAG: TPR end-of-group domain-containing protein [Gemmatimonadales bacterium]